MEKETTRPAVKTEVKFTRPQILLLDQFHLQLIILLVQAF